MWKKLILFFKNKPRVDVIFILIFFICLFIPMSHISDKKTSNFEKRYLAQWHPLINLDMNINANFGKDFDNWFNDRFFGRQKIISFNNLLKISLNDEINKHVIDRKTGFMYKKPDLKHEKNKVVINQFTNLYKLNEFCKKNNIKLYVIISPNKGDIYASPSFERLISIPKEKIYSNWTKKYIDYINKEGELKIIYPQAVFEKLANEKLLYFKTEHHWTDDGAFIVYKDLMQEIQKDFSNVIIFSPEDFNYGYSKLVRAEHNREFKYGAYCNTLALPNSYCKFLHKDVYKYYRHKKSEYLRKKFINKNFRRGRTFYYPFGANYKVMIFGTSNAENLLEFIPYSFRHVNQIRINSVKGIDEDDEFKIMKYYEKEILDYKPDILIFCISYTNIKYLDKLFDKD